MAYYQTVYLNIKKIGNKAPMKAMLLRYHSRHYNSNNDSNFQKQIFTTLAALLLLIISANCFRNEKKGCNYCQ